MPSIRRAAERRGLPFFEISAATHAGLPELVAHLFHEVVRAEREPKVDAAPDPAAP